MRRRRRHGRLQPAWRPADGRPGPARQSALSQCTVDDTKRGCAGTAADCCPPRTLSDLAARRHRNKRPTASQRGTTRDCTDASRALPRPVTSHHRSPPSRQLSLGGLDPTTAPRGHRGHRPGPGPQPHQRPPRHRTGAVQRVPRPLDGHAVFWGHCPPALLQSDRPCTCATSRQAAPQYGHNEGANPRPPAWPCSGPMPPQPNGTAPRRHRGSALQADCAVHHHRQPRPDRQYCSPLPQPGLPARRADPQRPEAVG